MVFVGFSSGFLLLRTKGVFVNQRDKLDHPDQWERWYFVEVGAGAMATNFYRTQVTWSDLCVRMSLRHKQTETPC